MEWLGVRQLGTLHYWVRWSFGQICRQPLACADAGGICWKIRLFLILWDMNAAWGSFNYTYSLLECNACERTVENLAGVKEEAGNLQSLATRFLSIMQNAKQPTFFFPFCLPTRCCLFVQWMADAPNAILKWVVYFMKPQKHYRWVNMEILIWRLSWFKSNKERRGGGIVHLLKCKCKVTRWCVRHFKIPAAKKCKFVEAVTLLPSESHTEVSHGIRSPQRNQRRQMITLAHASKSCFILRFI